jgi:transcriptional regulator with PAS, ATPase and Fis domain
LSRQARDNKREENIFLIAKERVCLVSAPERELFLKLGVEAMEDILRYAFAPNIRVVVPIIKRNLVAQQFQVDSTA